FPGTFTGDLDRVRRSLDVVFEIDPAGGTELRGGERALHRVPDGIETGGKLSGRELRGDVRSAVGRLLHVLAIRQNQPELDDRAKQHDEDGQDEDHLEGDRGTP